MSALETCLNKWRLVEACEGAVRVPVTRIVGPSDGIGVGDAFPGGFPVAAKPRTGFDSRGVTVVENRAGLAPLPFVAELAVNAVLYGVPGPGFAPPLSHHESLGIVRIAVTDLPPARLARSAPDPDESGGRRVLLVDVLAADWGLRDRPRPGKTVWAECATAPHLIRFVGASRYGVRLTGLSAPKPRPGHY
ncbi:hypothetical protein PZB75_24975 [Streptomyces sp. AM 4-1-1]|uniref:hypothetical protein n=1 Tax=Streptomyces sp. AM 4-1-1 TaxID=3028710 RepID=UPI0023B8F992|nr:hypothetical protein [Streptomyces sp. AM 4-1-1]WEH36316.1 hypothetical protein PZB75_24975 [Streptomyces sp. AM 4-1-1]